MDPKPASPEPVSRYRTLSLLLTGVCALLALVVLILLQRDPSVLLPPPSDSAARPGSAVDRPPEPGARASATERPVEIVIASGMTRIEGHVTLHATTRVYREAKQEAGVVAEIAPETGVDLVGRREEWTLISWAREGSGVWMGWVLLPGTPQGSGSTAAESEGREGTARIQGTVSLRGRPPVMKVPAKRKEADVCKDKAIVHNAVLVQDGKLADVLVRIAPGGVPGFFPPPSMHAVVEQKDCVYVPRIQGVVAGQTLDIKNADAALHNVHTYRGQESLFSRAQPKGPGPFSQETPDEAAIVKLTCDVHPWMRCFVVVTDHPFFAVTGADGAFGIERVPGGTYTLEAWHSRYGLLRREGVTVRDGEMVTVDFAYTGDEPEPPENKGELAALF